MSLFCSLRLIKDANESLSPRPRLLEPEKLASHIKYHSPRPISGQHTLLIPEIQNRLRTFSDYSETSPGLGNNIN